MTRLPKQWKGVYPGQYFGDIWQSQNIDLERYPGRLALSDKMRITVDDGDLAGGMGTPVKFIRTNADTTDRFWALTTSKMIKTSSTDPTTGWANDGLASSPTDPLDMEVHESANGEQRLVVTRATDIAILNRTGAANTWTSSWWQGTLAQAALQSAKYHPIAKVQRLLGIGDVEKFHTISSADAVVNSDITLSYGYEITQAYGSSNRFWILARSNNGRKGKIIEWDGSSDAQNNEYEVAGTFPMVGWIQGDNPWVIDELGYIYKYGSNGGQGMFAPVQEFPMAEELLLFDEESSVFDDTCISPYGADVDRHLVYLLVGANQNSRRTRSGVWIFNTKNFNLYHHMGLGRHKSAGTDVNYSDTPLSTAGGLKFVTTGLTTPTLIAGAKTHISFGVSTRNAVYFRTPNRNQSSNSGRNRGYVITPYIKGDEVEAMWEYVYMKFKKFNNSGNRLILKYRVVEPLRDAGASDESVLQPTSGTWVSTTTFTTAVPTGVAVGDEVEVLSGDNGGCSFTILTLSGTPDSSTTLTVTISEAAPTSSTSISIFRFDNWKELGTISSTSVGNQKLPFPSAAHGEFVQLKIEMRGFSVEIDEILPMEKIKSAVKQG